MLSNEHQQYCPSFVIGLLDMPTPRVLSRQWLCAGCDAPIWVPKKSPVALPKICIRCTGRDKSTPPKRPRDRRQRSRRVGGLDQTSQCQLRHVSNFGVGEATAPAHGHEITDARRSCC